MGNIGVVIGYPFVVRGRLARQKRDLRGTQWVCREMASADCVGGVSLEGEEGWLGCTRSRSSIAARLTVQGDIFIAAAEECLVSKVLLEDSFLQAQGVDVWDWITDVQMSKMHGTGP